MPVPNGVKARRVLESVRTRLEEVRAEGDDLLPTELVQVFDEQIEVARQLAPGCVTLDALPPLIAADSIASGEPVVVMNLLLRLDGLIRGLPNSWIENPRGRVTTTNG